MDTLSDTGQADNADNISYKNRVKPILTALRGECFLYSDTHAAGDGIRAVCTPITSLSENIGIDDVLAQTVLPFGLAAQLLLDENPSAASFFQQRYEELLKKFRDVPRSTEDIENLYGGIEFSAYEAW